MIRVIFYWVALLPVIDSRHETWSCPEYLLLSGCPDGRYYCECPGQGEVWYKIGCCWDSGCGVICNRKHNCDVYANCATCLSGISIEGNLNVCRTCKAGYALGSGNCQADINECQSRNGDCAHQCINTHGSYHCTCRDGFRLRSDKHGCEDTSENAYIEASDAMIEASEGIKNATVGYPDHETNLVESVKFKIGLSVLVTIVALCLIIYLTYQSVIFLRNKWRIYVQKKGFEFLNELDRKDTMLLKLLPEKLQSRLKGCLIDVDDLEIDTQLGKGNFGVVHKGVLKTGGNVVSVAVKAIKKLDISFGDIEDFLHEATITRGLDHPNVLKIIGVSIDRRDCRVVLPFMEKGNLRDFLLDKQNHFKVGELVELMLQAAKGMGYLESRNVLHRDVAARNCMVDGNGVVKIADFGLSHDLYQGHYYQATTSRPLPVRWMAIESLANNGVFTIKTDVWAFGVLLWEIMTRGITPYSNIDPREQLLHLRQGGRLDKPHNCPDPLYVLMMRCWVLRPRDRPSFKDVVVSIRYILYPNGEDETDSDHAMDKQRHERSAAATGDQDIESGIEDTSFSRPGKRFHQASTRGDRPVTHLRNENPVEQHAEPSRDEEQELQTQQTSRSSCHASNRAEYLVIIESPMLSDCD